jgi:hypothetical protein
MDTAKAEVDLRLRDFQPESMPQSPAHEIALPQSELLRHSKIQTTLQVYTQAVGDQKRAAHGQVVEQLLGKSIYDSAD